MKITKYPQSCMTMAKDGHVVLIDPGSIALEQFGWNDFGDFEAVLFTHQHFDHFVKESLPQIKARGAAIYANADVCALAEPGVINQISDGDEFEAAGFKVKAYDLPHCKMQDGSDGPPNTGFVLENFLFHAGDGISLPGLHVPAVALPIAGPTIGFENAAAFAKELAAQKIIPIHYDYFKADPVEFKQFYKEAEVIPLQPGQSVELVSA